MSEQLVRDAFRFAKGSVIHVAGKTFTAEELRDGLDRLINPPTPAPEAAPEAASEAEPKAESKKPEAPKAKKTTTKRKPAGGTVEQLV